MIDLLTILSGRFLNSRRKELERNFFAFQKDVMADILSLAGRVLYSSGLAAQPGCPMDRVQTCAFTASGAWPGHAIVHWILQFNRAFTASSASTGHAIVHWILLLNCALLYSSRGQATRASDG